MKKFTYLLAVAAVFTACNSCLLYTSRILQKGTQGRIGEAETLPFQNMKYLIQMEIEAGKLSTGIKGFMLQQTADAT